MEHRDDHSASGEVLASGQGSWRGNDEKFDLSDAANTLRQHLTKVESEKKAQKRREKLEERERFLKLHPNGDVVRHLELYEMGKHKIIMSKKVDKPRTKPRSASSSPAPIAICEKLYNETLGIKEQGKKKRQEIERQRALANPEPPELPFSIRKQRSFSVRTRGSDSPTPEEVMERLYGRSLSLQMNGKQRKEEIERQREIANPQPPELPLSPVRKQNSSRSKARDSPSPEEVMERLYSRSKSLQLDGKQRQEEIERQREIANPRPPELPVAIHRRHSFSVRKGRDSPSPEEVMERLYSRAKESQINGKQRKEEIERERDESNSKPRIVL